MISLHSLFQHGFCLAWTWNQVQKQRLGLKWWHLLAATRCSALSLPLKHTPRVTAIRCSAKLGPHGVCWSGCRQKGRQKTERGMGGAAGKQLLGLMFLLCLLRCLLYGLLPVSRLFSQLGCVSIPQSKAESSLGWMQWDYCWGCCSLPSSKLPKAVFFLKKISKELTTKWKMTKTIVLVMLAGFLSAVSAVDVQPAWEYRSHLRLQYKLFPPSP